MRTAWIFPDDRKCGIAIYSRDYAAALKPLTGLSCFDPSEWLRNRRAMSAELNNCDIVHIQYETGFFIRNNKDFYFDLCRSIHRPIIVSLHEIYRSNPFVFPREKLKGKGMTLFIKRLIYDRRHPSVTAYRRHVRACFNARLLLLHHEFQKEILSGSGIPSERMKILPHPVKDLPAGVGRKDKTDGIAHLGTTGFVNPLYDYDLLFETLDKLDIPWDFVWIGGLRNDEHKGLLDDINARIARKGWDRRFRIMGWVDTETQAGLLAGLDIYLALFKDRSTSSSITRPIGARRLIIGTDIPPLREIAETGDCMVITPFDAVRTAGRIKSLLNDKHLREQCLTGIERYIHANTYEAAVSKLIAWYRELSTK